MSAHTPGPWTAVQDGNVDWYIVDENESVIVFGLSEPDARLIAAAPDMLDALRAVRAYHNGGSPYSVDAIDAAIAKAEGK